MAPTEILARQHHARPGAAARGAGRRAEFLSGSLTPPRKRRDPRRDRGGRGRGGDRHARGDQRGGRVPSGSGWRWSTSSTDSASRSAPRCRPRAAGCEPHVLALTATPIPRTLALTFYGDLAIRPARDAARAASRSAPRSATVARCRGSRSSWPPRRGTGARASWSCPLVAESEALTAASAEAEAERLRRRCRSCAIGLVHGQQRADDRDATMQPLRRRGADVLVATTVIEVGIDVPNASVMLIEDAERFGLAQLHQLRGRVGRGPHRSFCILLSDAVDDRSRERLRGGARTRATGSRSPRRTCGCAARATCSARGSPACRRCGWPRSSSRGTWCWPSEPATLADGLVAADPTLAAAPSWRGCATSSRALERGGRRGVSARAACA